VRRQFVVPAVAGQEGHPPAAYVANGDGRRRRPVGRVEDDLDGIVEEGVEAGAAEDADLGCLPRSIPRGRGPTHAILLSFFFVESFFESLLLDEESDDELDDELDDESDEDEEPDEDEESDDELVSFSLGLGDVAFPVPRLSVL
jgi:hypothetical protein